MRPTQSVLTALAISLFANAAGADELINTGRPLLQTSISAGFAPPLFRGSESCTIKENAVVKAVHSSLFSTSETQPLTRADLEAFDAALAEAQAAGLTDKGPAPLDAPWRMNSAFLPDGTRILLSGIENGRIIENQSSAADGLLFVLQKHCGRL